jgi:hypothetical protein
MRISRKIRNERRCEQRARSGLHARFEHARNASPKERRVMEEAERLWLEYKDKGATWSACVQAVKTDWVGQLRAKYDNK